MASSTHSRAPLPLVPERSVPGRVVQLPVAGPTDAELVYAVRAGHPRAEETLFRRHAPAVLRIASRLLRDPHEAEDIVQEAFTAAHERLASLSEPAAYRGWLVQIAIRLVHRRFRRARLLRVLGIVGEVEAASLAEQAADELAPEARLDLRRIDEALAELGAPERSAWILRHVEGLTLEETAAACETSLATCKRRLARARDAVRRHLGADLEGDDD